ncbi:hypothetical protein BGZ57DRAFT_921651 [Hyaloscypha finlandica]|nr:hypothetical protein BGZ57DRAFT_921651 [Hyaloscypha finlandica]
MPTSNSLLHPHVEPLTGITIRTGSIDGHFFIDRTILIVSALQSIAVTIPSLSVDVNKVVYLDEAYPPQLSIISGSRSGHEPSFTGYIEVALTQVDAKHGILAIIMNHRGNVANFKAAISKFKTSGIRTELMVVGDDVGHGRIRAQKHGRSGIAGPVLILKVAGAFAATGATSDDDTRVAGLTAHQVLSVGSAISHVKKPNQPIQDKQSDELLATERSGREPDLVNISFLDLTSLRWTCSILRKPRCKNFWTGAMNILEKKYGTKPARVYSEKFTSTLNKLGFSISLIKVVGLGLQTD